MIRRFTSAQFVPANAGAKAKNPVGSTLFSTPMVAPLRHPGHKILRTSCHESARKRLNASEIVRKASGESLDLKPYEADMRHLIDTYIEADEPRKISPFDNMSLIDLIVKTGIAHAIATRLGNMKGNKDVVAETIENNVRSKIIQEHLNDPAYFEKMSALLDEIIAARKAKAIAYEELLKRYAELVKRVEAGQAEDAPAQLNTPGRRALYNNLKQSTSHRIARVAASSTSAAGDDALDLALKIDYVVKSGRPDRWRGVQSREQTIRSALSVCL